MEKMGNTKENYMAGIGCTLCGGICWGLSGCFGQYLFQVKGVTAEWLVTVRLTFAGILLILLGLLLSGKRMGEVWKTKEDAKELLFFAIAGMLTCQYTYFLAIEASNAGTATVLQSLAPLMILVTVCIKGKRLPQRFEGMAIFGALLGVFLLSTHGDIHSMSLTKTALFCGLAAALSAAVYNLLSGALLKKYGVYTVAGYGMLLAGIVMLCIVRPWRYAIVLDREMLLALAGVILIGTAIAFSLYLKGVSIVGPFVGSILAMVEPVTAVVISSAFLGQAFHVLDIVGFILILGTAAMLSLRSKEK